MFIPTKLDYSCWKRIHRTREDDKRDVFSWSIEGRGRALLVSCFSPESWVGGEGRRWKRSLRSQGNAFHNCLCLHLDSQRKKHPNIPPKRPFVLMATTSQKQVKQCVGKFFGLVRIWQSAITSRSTNRHQYFFSFFLASFYSVLDFRASK